MKFWCFHFEGFFSEDSTEYPNEGVFSECLVQAETYNNAEFAFLTALSERKINLLEVENSFLVDTDPNELDYENPDNIYWIEWCEEVELSKKPSFEVFHLYPANEVEKSGIKKGS